MAAVPRFCSLAEFYDAIPLDPAKRCIRVIDVHGCSTPFPMAEPLFATMRVVDLNMRPKFTTLSYVWGARSDSNSTVITLRFESRTAELRLTTNCWEALSHLRAKLGSFTIWVDAICIDQGRNGEQTHQVSQMGNIYSISVSTYIWLGPCDERTERGLDALTSIGLTKFFFESKDDQSIQMEPKPLKAYIHIIRVYLARATIRICGPLFGKEGLLSMRQLHKTNTLTPADLDFLDQEWLRRMWTYQEVMFAQNPIVVFGQRHIPWLRLMVGVYHIVSLRIDRAWPETSQARRVTKEWYTLIRDTDTFQREYMQRLATSSTSKSVSLEQYDAFLSAAGSFWLFSSTLVQMVTLIFGIAIACYRVGLIAFLLRMAVFIGSLWCAISSPLASYVHLKLDPRPLGLLETLASRTCSITKDYNFAMRSILGVLLGSEMKSLDYTLPQERIDHDLSANLIRVLKDPQLICTAISFPASRGCPSWVTSWYQYQPQVIGDMWKSQLSLCQPKLPFEHGKGDIRFHPSLSEVICISGQDLGHITRVFRFHATQHCIYEQDTHLHIHNFETLNALLGCFPQSLVKHYLGCNVRNLKYFVEQSNDLYALLALTQNRHIQHPDDIDKSECTHVETLVKGFNRLASEDLCLIAMEPACQCGACRIRLGLIKDSSGTYHASRVTEADRVLRIPGVIPNIVIRARPGQRCDEKRGFELISLATFGSYFLPNVWGFSEGNPICHRLWHAELSSFNIS